MAKILRFAWVLLIPLTLSACEDRLSLTRLDFPYYGYIAPDITEVQILSMEDAYDAGAYSFTLTPVGNDLNLYVKNNLNDIICTSELTGVTSDNCVVVDPERAAIKLDVAPASGGGGEYLLELVVLREGSMIRPFPINLEASALGLLSGANFTDGSYYAFSELLPNTNYNVTIDLPTSDVQYQVYDDAFVTIQAGGNGVITAGVTTNISGTTNASGVLFIKIWENTGGAVAAYTLFLN